MPLTRSQLQVVVDHCNGRADFSEHCATDEAELPSTVEWRKRYVRDLRGVAKDAQAAMDGDDEAMVSVLEWVDDDCDLSYKVYRHA